MGSGGEEKSRDWGRRAFSPARLRTISAIAEAMLSDEDDRGAVQPPPAELTLRVTDEFDLLIGAGSPDLSRGFRVLAWVIEWLPIIILGAFCRASRLSLERRVRYLDRLENAKIALMAPLLIAFKLPIVMLAFETGQDLHSTGFDRESLASAREPSRALQVSGG